MNENRLCGSAATISSASNRRSRSRFGIAANCGSTSGEKITPMPRVYSLIAKPVKSNIRYREYSLTDVNMGLMPQPPIQGLPSRRMKSPVRPTPLTPQNVNRRQRSDLTRYF
jgi:hypothetical protein